MKGTIRNFFSEGNTSYGFYSYCQSFINEGTEKRKTYYIKGGTNSDISCLMKKIGELFMNKGYNIEYYHCCYNNDFLRSVVIKDLEIYLVNYNTQHIIENNKEIKNTFERAYKFMGAAKLIHDDWSTFNEKALDYSKLLLTEENLKNKIFQDISPNALGSERHTFATAFTPDGIITFIEDLTSNCNKVYVLNGGPGTGKNQVLNFIYKEALRRGFFIEVYHNPLISKRIEHIIIPELTTAVITSNEINNMNFPGIQMFMENLLNYSKINKEELTQSKKTFYDLLNKALSIMSSTKQLHDNVDNHYICSMNFEDIDKTYKNLLDKLLSYEKTYIYQKNLEKF